MIFPASAILFDLDGTLADTAPDMANALNLLTQRHKKPDVPYQIARNSVSKGSLAVVKCGFGDNLDEALLKQLQTEFLEIYSQNICINTRLFPGLAEALNLIEKNNLLWGVVTNKPGWLAEPLLKKMNLHHRAACIVSGDTLEKRKPHPDPLLHACQLISIQPENCIYFGDDERDAQAAIAANMPMVIAAYGYIGEQETPEKWGTEHFVHDSNKMSTWLQENILLNLSKAKPLAN